MNSRFDTDRAKGLFVAVLASLLVACGGDGGSTDPNVVAVTPTQVLSLTTAPSCSMPTVAPSTGTAAVVWSYTNTSNASTATTVTVPTVVPGQVVTIIFSNGTTSTLARPGIGVSPDAGRAPVAAAMEQGQLGMSLPADDNGDEAHSRLQESNRQIAQTLRLVSGKKLNADAAALQVMRPPALDAPANGVARTWIDGPPGSPVTNYATSVETACLAPNGRNVVVWVDPVARKLDKVSASSVAAIANTYCGTKGGFDQVTRLLGDAWGAGANQYNDLIQDPGALQDINVVVVNAPANAGWAGYFWAGNNLLKSTEPNSNQALVFFINANELKQDLNFTLSTLLHETTHMVNFYQHSVVKGFDHDIWLEETSAMMTEDIVSPTTVCKADGSGYNKIANYRLPIYLKTGGAVSYINWPDLSGPNYGLGGAFGAFLNRRYGLKIYQGLIGSCADGVANTTSYGCLDNLIKNNGGVGFADEFARLGATAFGALPPSPPAGGAAGYGFPAVTSLGYNLMSIDVSTMLTIVPATASPLTSGNTATTHTYLRDTVAAGVTTYMRRNMVIPAKTTVSVVLK
jgi:hypothetical protein